MTTNLPKAAPVLTATPFCFLRHGETDWNRLGRSQGRTDIPLNEAGLAQARQAAALLGASGLARIVCSPLGRAQETARIVGAALHLDFTTDADLQEASFGDQEGKPMGPWYDDWVEGAYTPSGGEPFDRLCVRAVGAVNRALAGPGLVLIVAHGAFFRAVRSSMGLSPHIRTDNGVPLYCRPGSPWSIEPISPG